MRTSRRPFTPCRSPDGRFAIAPLALAILMAVGAQQAQAQAAEGGGATQSISIAAQPLSQALTELARQTSTTLVAAPALLAGKTAPAVSGTLSARQALDRLLTGSGLIGFLNGGVITVQQAPQPGGEATLATVTVTESAEQRAHELSPAYAGGQIARGSRVGMLGNRDVMDTPFNVTGYTAEFIENSGATTLGEVLKNDPSVGIASAPLSGFETFSLRGFQSADGNPTFSFNGLFGVLPYWSSGVDFAERIEVFKGPSAMLNGMPASYGHGGSVNIVSKRAGNGPQNKLMLGYTSKSQPSVSADFSRRFGVDKSIGLRFNGTWKDGEKSVNGTNESLKSGMLGMDWQGNKTRLFADIGYQEDQVNGANRPIAASTYTPNVPDHRRSLMPAWGGFGNRTTFGIIRGEWDVRDGVTAFAAYGKRQGVNKNVVVNPVLSGTQGGAWSSGVTRAARTESETEAISAGVNAEFVTGAVQHRLAISADDYTHDSRSASSPSITVSSNIYTPVSIPEPIWTLGPLGATSTTQLSGVGVADTLSILEDRLQVTFGIRHQKISSQSSSASYSSSAWTPAATVVMKPVQNASIYANYIQSLQAGRVVSDQYSNANEVFPPYKSTQYETGVKIDWSERLMTTLSIYQISRPSFVNVQNGDGTTRQAPDGETRNRGVEFNFFGEPIKGLRINGGIALVNSELTRTQNGTYDGKKASGMPKGKSTLGAEWDVANIPGLTLLGRVTRTEKAWIDQANTRPVNAWTLVDVGARYRFSSSPGKFTTLRLNVDNLLNKNFWMSLNAGPYIATSLPRTIRLSATFDF